MPHCHVLGVTLTLAHASYQANAPHYVFVPLTKLIADITRWLRTLRVFVVDLEGQLWMLLQQRTDKRVSSDALRIFRHYST